MNNTFLDSLTDWDEFKHCLGLTPKEWDEIDQKVQIAGEAMKSRLRESALDSSFDDKRAVVPEIS
jgi:hypothetical protein